jgi:hypothetical protein
MRWIQWVLNFLAMCMVSKIQKKLLHVIQEKFLEMIQKDEITWIKGEKRKITSFQIEYFSNVGLMNVVSKKSLNEENGEKIKKIHRSQCLGESDILVDIISGIELLPTKIIYVEIIETKEFPFCVVTAFPNCLADNLLDDEIVFVV